MVRRIFEFSLIVFSLLAGSWFFIQFSPDPNVPPRPEAEWFRSDKIMAIIWFIGVAITLLGKKIPSFFWLGVGMLGVTVSGWLLPRAVLLLFGVTEEFIPGWQALLPLLPALTGLLLDRTGKTKGILGDTLMVLTILVALLGMFLQFIAMGVAWS